MHNVKSILGIGLFPNKEDLVTCHTTLQSELMVALLFVSWPFLHSGFRLLNGCSVHSVIGSLNLYNEWSDFDLSETHLGFWDNQYHKVYVCSLYHVSFFLILTPHIYLQSSSLYLKKENIMKNEKYQVLWIAENFSRCLSVIAVKIRVQNSVR